jgi:phenylacetate-CoA ligase
VTESGIELRSRVASISWPAVPSARGAQLLSLLHQFEQTQWWSAERLLEHQLRQIQLLLQHAVATVPFYRERLTAVGFDPKQKLTHDIFRALPLLTRREVQLAGTALHSTALPAAYGRVGETRTSGSTGEPLKVRRTQFDQLLWEANLLRDHHWHKRDLSGKLALIRAEAKDAQPPNGVLRSNWGRAAELYKTGVLAVLDAAADVQSQANWILRQDPDYLMLYPSILKSLVAWFSTHAERPARLREVRTLGETLDPSLREACRDVLGLPIVDGYSSEEMGYIALQCPMSEALHVMSESVLLEIIDDQGKASAHGEIGQVVATTLHNAAMPLLRYALGDHAIAGAPCPCGRGLSTITRVLGKIRNLVTLPSGKRFRPRFIDEFMRFPMVRQYQMIQRSLEDVEARLVVDKPLTAEVETRLRTVLQGAIGYPFHISFIYFSGELPRGPRGKFEEFVSRLSG